MGKLSGRTCRLMLMFWMTAVYFFVEIIVGYVTNSMALVADSFHMLSDLVALMVAYVSVKMSPRKWSKNTFGWARAEVLGALINAVFLVALCFSITVEACKRFIELEAIRDPQLLLVVGGVGLLVNVIGLFLFHEHGSSHTHAHAHAHVQPQLAHTTSRLSELVLPSIDNEERCSHNHSNHQNAQQMNMRGVFLHVASDAIGSVIVIISALVFWLTNWRYRYYIDPALSIVLVLLILHSVWPLLRDSALILLQTVPTHIELEAIQGRLARLEGVVGVHEFHIWQLAGDKIIASAHIKCRNISEYMKIAKQVKEFFHNEGIHSTTIQPEFLDPHAEMSDNEDCFLECPRTTKGESCIHSTCCGSSKV